MKKHGINPAAESRGRRRTGRGPLMLALLLAVGSGCRTAPPPQLGVLDAGMSLPAATRGNTPSLVVALPSLPELLDRPQLVVRTHGNQAVFSDQVRWAEPLRQAITRLLAQELGQVLNSGRVFVQSGNLQRLDPDYRLQLDIQRLDAIAGQGVDVDILWLLEPRQGKVVVGRTTLRQPLPAAGTAAGDGHLPFVEATREALLRVAREVAKTLTATTASRPFTLPARTTPAQ